MFGLFEKEKKQKKPVRRVKKQAPAKPDSPSAGELLAVITRMQKELDHLKLVITGGGVFLPTEEKSVYDEAMEEVKQKASTIVRSESEKVLEGVFDGQNMIGADGQQYDVPANYASKSKLVEGDILKLTINNLGSFVYKQIKPIERLRKVGALEQDPQSLQYYATDDGKRWKLLTASVTYFRGEPGDEVVFLIPADGGSRWAAVENIVKK
ncbi:hypothetical protein KKC32_04780 [Patescibacteria group bacterium]|nr:hypothetical protein [Patescibacteria group bacterium]